MLIYHWKKTCKINGVCFNYRTACGLDEFIDELDAYRTEERPFKGLDIFQGKLIIGLTWMGRDVEFENRPRQKYYRVDRDSDQTVKERKETRSKNYNHEYCWHIGNLPDPYDIFNED